jgi:hypothetical protein
VAFWDGYAWNDLPYISLVAGVHALLSWGDTLIAGGQFWTSPSDQVAIFRLEGDHWSPMDTLGLVVECLAIYRGEFYASGESFFYDPRPPSVYRWDGARWRSLGVIRGTKPSVGAMLVHEGRLVAAGKFDGIGEASSVGLAAWDGVRWAPIANLPDPARVRALAVHEGRLVVGGSFANTSVVLCDGALVQPLGAFMGEVTSLASIRGHLFAGLRDRNGLREWNGSEWGPLEGGVNLSVETLLAMNDRLYAGGAFTVAGSHSSFGIARWDGLAQGPDIPTIVTLEAGVPNPSRSSVVLAYRIGISGKVRTAVLDLGGREIAVLEDGWLTPGIHSIQWDGRDARGNRVRPGVYLVRARLPGSPDRIWRVVRLQ